MDATFSFLTTFENHGKRQLPRAQFNRYAKYLDEEIVIYDVSNKWGFFMVKWDGSTGTTASISYKRIPNSCFPCRF